MHRSLAFLWPGLLLVCCDKPESPDPRKDATPQSTSRVPSRVDSSALQNDADPPVAWLLREEPAPPATLPSIPETAATIDSPPPRKEPAPITSAALRTIYEAAVKIKSPAVREKALADVAWNALEIDPQLASEAFLQLPTDSAEKLRLIQHYALRLAEQDPATAHTWAATLGTEQEIAAANSQIALVLAETDPQRAANLLSQSGVVSRDFDVAVVQVVQRWSAQSPPDAAAWVSLFPPGAAREAGIKIITEQWLPRDAPAVFNWLDTLQDKVLRQETLRAMEGVILQQPQNIRDEWLQYADANIQGELQQQLQQALKDVGNNLPANAR